MTQDWAAPGPAGGGARLRVGTPVRILPLALTGTVAAVHGDEYAVAVGELRVLCAVADLAPAAAVPADRAPAVQVHWQAPAATQLDLHGLTTDEALPTVDAFLNRSFLAGSGLVRLVHGKGGGVLQRWLDVYLAEHPLVAAFRRGWYGEGDNGVTVVTLQPGKG